MEATLRDGCLAAGRGGGLGARLGDQAFALRLLAGELAGPTHGFVFLADPLFRGLLVGPATLQLAEDTFALQLPLQNLEGLVDIVLTDFDLQGNSPFRRSDGCRSVAP